MIKALCLSEMVLITPSQGDLKISDVGFTATEGPITLLEMMVFLIIEGGSTFPSKGDLTLLSVEGSITDKNFLKRLNIKPLVRGLTLEQYFNFLGRKKIRVKANRKDYVS